jgi:starvation-inducible DNA-binding protein
MKDMHTNNHEKHRVARENLRPTSLTTAAVADISVSLNAILADMFALFFKTKSFHWHVTGPQFRDYHLLLDEQAAQIFAATDPIAERVRKLGGVTLLSMTHATKLQRVIDNDRNDLATFDMLAQLLVDNQQIAVRLKDARALCEERGDVASPSLIDSWIDEAEGRAWYLAEIIA